MASKTEIIAEPGKRELFIKRGRIARVPSSMQAMLQMQKLDIQKPKHAYEGS